MDAADSGRSDGFRPAGRGPVGVPAARLAGGARGGAQDAGGGTAGSRAASLPLPGAAGRPRNPERALPVRLHGSRERRVEPLRGGAAVRRLARLALVAPAVTGIAAAAPAKAAATSLSLPMQIVV